MNRDTSSAASSASSMKKWGIPQDDTPEVSLLERLVWVRYKSRWWPALLYHSYSELQQFLYDQLDMVLKAQFAMAIMKQIQEKREIKVARLLGRNILEVIEVQEDCYCEFYWQLPNILPKACKASHYGDDLDLYFDFHRALDQVETIIREVSEENFALLPDSDNQTWLDRAHLAINGDKGSLVDKIHGDNRRKRTMEKSQTEQSVFSNNSHSVKASVTEHVSVDATPSGLSSGMREINTASSEARSRHSINTKHSEALTEVVDNRTNPLVNQEHQRQQPEYREPFTYDFRTSSITQQVAKNLRSYSPFDVFPGLEGEVSKVRSSFNTVFGVTSPDQCDDSSTAYQQETRDAMDAEERPLYGLPSPPSVSNGAGRVSDPETMPIVSNKAMMSAILSPEDQQFVAAAAGDAIRRAGQVDTRSFWERLTCYSTDL